LHTLSSVPDDEKSLSTVFRVQYFFLVVCALLSLSSRVLYNPHSTIAQPNWYFPGLSHPSRQRQGKKKEKRKERLDQLGRPILQGRETLSPTAFKIEIIHHASSSSSAGSLFLIFLFLVRRLFKHAFTIFHFFLFSTAHFLFTKRRTHANTGTTD
jgi:hypothetical protein